MSSFTDFGEWVESYRNGYGIRPGPGESGPIVLRIADVSSGTIDLSSPRRGLVSEKLAKTYRLVSGDLLVIRVNGAREIVGRCCVVGPEIPPDTIFNDHLIRVRLKSGLDAEFARLCFNSTAARAIIEEAAATSAGQLTISQQVLERVQIPELPLTTQREVAARLKARLAEVDRTCRAAKIQLIEISKLADAYIVQSLKSQKTVLGSLSGMLDEIKIGIGSTWSNYPVHGATRDGLAPAKEPPGKHAPKYKPAFPGTVFYNPMRIMIGSIAFVDDDDQPGITSPDYVVLRGRAGMVDSRWFYYWLRSPLGVQCINELARGAVRERMLFNRLADGKVELPSFAVQRKTSLALKELKSLRTTIQTNLSEINMLSRKILAQAFES